MKKALIAMAVAAGLFVVTAVCFAMWAVGVRDTQADLKVRYEMKLVDNNSQFDNMWKTIAQLAQIPEQKKNAYKEILVGVADARTSEGQGRMMAWIKEQNPSVDLSIYDQLSNKVEAHRAAWTGNQKALVGVAEEYNKNLAPLIRGTVLRMFGFAEIKPQIVTSSRTEAAFRSGRDDDIQLFQK